MSTTNKFSNIGKTYYRPSPFGKHAEWAKLRAADPCGAGFVVFRRTLTPSTTV